MPAFYFYWCAALVGILSGVVGSNFTSVLGCITGLSLMLVLYIIDAICMSVKSK